MKKALISTVFLAAALAMPCVPWGQTGGDRVEQVRGAVAGPLAWEAWGRIVEYEVGSHGQTTGAEPTWGTLAGMGSRIVVQLAFEEDWAARREAKKDCEAMSILGSVVRHTLGGRRKASGA